MGIFNPKTVLLVTIASFVSISNSLEYPRAYRNDSTRDDFHGTIVGDPYRWLEDPQSPQTLDFIDAQRNLTQPYLEASSIRGIVREKLTKMWNYPKVGPPSKHGDKFYYFANSGILNQDVLYMKRTLDSDPEVFFDPNALSQNGTVALQTGTAVFSPSGKLFAYGLATSGSDWFRIFFRSTESGQDLADVLIKAKFTILHWTNDDSGIFYGAYPHMEEGDPGLTQNQKIFFHRIGTNQSEDVLIVDYPDKPHWMIGYFDVARDGRTLIMAPFGDGSYGDTILSVARIPEEINGRLELSHIVTEFTAKFLYLTSVGSWLYFKTNKGAPNYKIIRIDLNNPDESRWETIVPEHENRVLDLIAHVDKDKLLITYLEDVKSQIMVVNATDGSLLVEKYPLEIGNVYWDLSPASADEPVFFFKFENFLIPNRLYMVNFTDNMENLTVYEDVSVDGLDPNDFETKQVFFPSKDGTRIPMYITHKKGLKMDGESFANLYGYGGFGLSVLPQFSVPRIVFMQNFNGVAAIANLRGGGEYGKPWHDSGILDKKQNVFDDFQSAAEYLIRNNYTSNSKVVIEGESNGGLLLGACLNQRPDLYGAAIPRVGVMDMLRYHHFGIGYFWINEYGSSENPEQFDYIYKYSPLHNIRMPNEAQFPATLVTTSLQDDRVVPSHSLKYAAELQYAIGRNSKQANPLLIRIEDGAGHGGGKPTEKLIEEEVDIFSFLSQSIGLQLTD